MYVVMNVLTVPENFKEEMIQRFANSADNMSSVKGCVEFQFLNHTSDGKQIVYTKWSSKDDYQAWIESDSFKRAHEKRRANPGPATAKIETYEVIHNRAYE